MLESNRGEDPLEREIRASRKASSDGATVVYDLRFSVDFSKPRRTAEAIARVVWDEDAKGWWSVVDDQPTCTPTSTVELWVPDQHNRRIAKAVEDFKADLRKEELGDEMSGYLASVEDRNPDWAAVFLLGPLWAYLLQVIDNRDKRKVALTYLFLEMAGHIVIRP